MVIESRFVHCVMIIISHEGGLSRNSHDPGGITQWGISLRYLKSIGHDVDGDGDIDADDIINLPINGAIEIYRNYWWDKYSYASFGAIEVVEKVFDLAVNMGATGAHKLLQIAINRLIDKPIGVDGILGKNTFATANRLDENELRQQLRECAEHRYIEILAANPALEIFRNGWMNRAKW